MHMQSAITYPRGVVANSRTPRIDEMMSRGERASPLSYPSLSYTGHPANRRVYSMT